MLKLPVPISQFEYHIITIFSYIQYYPTSLNTDEYEYDSPPPCPHKKEKQEANRYNGSFEVSCDYLNLT